MTPADFDRLAAKTSLKPRALGMARRILVDGISAAQAGREAGRTRSEASRAEWRIRTEALHEHICPTCHRPL